MRYFACLSCELCVGASQLPVSKLLMQAWVVCGLLHSFTVYLEFPAAESLLYINVEKEALRKLVKEPCSLC